MVHLFYPKHKTQKIAIPLQQRLVESSPPVSSHPNNQPLVQIQMIDSSDIPQIIATRINQFAWSLPTEHSQRQHIIQAYTSHKGYEFLNPKSKLYKYFLARYLQAQAQKAMDEEVVVKMEGNLEQLTVGGMVEIVKQNMSQGIRPYQPVEAVVCEREFSFTMDSALYQDTSKALHKIKIDQMEARQAKKKLELANQSRPPNKTNEPIKQTKDDGSMGVWGGNKYEGLGSRNDFTEFRREQSKSYYQNMRSHADKRKP